LNNRIIFRALPKRLQGLNQKQIQKRKKFAEEYLGWDNFDWELLIFSDESDLFPAKCGRGVFPSKRESEYYGCSS